MPAHFNSDQVKDMFVSDASSPETEENDSSPLPIGADEDEEKERISSDKLNDIMTAHFSDDEEGEEEETDSQNGLGKTHRNSIMSKRTSLSKTAEYATHFHNEKTMPEMGASPQGRYDESTYLDAVHRQQISVLGGDTSTYQVVSRTPAETLPLQFAPPAAKEDNYYNDLHHIIVHLMALKQNLQASPSEQCGIRAAPSNTKEEEEGKSSARKNRLCAEHFQIGIKLAGKCALHNENLRLQQQLRIMTSRVSQHEKYLSDKVKALEEECRSLRIENSELRDQQARKRSLRSTLATNCSMKKSCSCAEKPVNMLKTIPSTSGGTDSNSHTCRDSSQHQTQAGPMDKKAGYSKVKDLESMLNLQAQIKSKVVLELNAKRQEVNELRDFMSLPLTTHARKLGIVNQIASLRLRLQGTTRRFERLHLEKKVAYKASTMQRRVQLERYRHQQKMRALQSQQLHMLYQQAFERFLKKKDRDPRKKCQQGPYQHVKENTRHINHSSPGTNNLPEESSIGAVAKEDGGCSYPVTFSKTISSSDNISFESLRKVLLPQTSPKSQV
ncbi:hypothetical protein Naga_100010g93 [Nannochloropsis gaditana]|uniref:Uncharacterized protein n=1 Tax=Nannochloropsis gaditana TaxID=72520 RepID=W7U2P6_9STRA|nr:hypothetical protein Naga_100010g93 [Nannochloropsis gaditana]